MLWKEVLEKKESLFSIQPLLGFRNFLACYPYCIGFCYYRFSTNSCGYTCIATLRLISFQICQISDTNKNNTHKDRQKQFKLVFKKYV